MASCTGGQLPYQYEYYGIYGAGSTPEAACGALAKSVGSTLSGFVEAVTNRCNMTSADENRSANPYVLVCDLPEDAPTTPTTGNVVNCSQACSVSLAIAAPELSAERVQADLLVWGACLLLLVTVYAGKVIYGVFHTGRSES